jgi:hypothetical protein
VALDAFAPTASTNPEDDVVTKAAAAPAARLKKKKSMAAAAPEVAAEPPVVSRGEFCSITAMPVHEHLSFEELRVRQMQVRFSESILHVSGFFVATNHAEHFLSCLCLVRASTQALPDLVTAHHGGPRSAYPALPRYLSYLFEERAINRARAEEERARAEAALVAEVTEALHATLDEIASTFEAEARAAEIAAQRAAEEAREIQRAADAAAAAEKERRQQWNPKAFFEQKCKAGATSGLARQNSMLMEKAVVCASLFCNLLIVFVLLIVLVCGCRNSHRWPLIFRTLSCLLRLWLCFSLPGSRQVRRQGR